MSSNWRSDRLAVDYSHTIGEMDMVSVTVSKTKTYQNGTNMLSVKYKMKKNLQHQNLTWRDEVSNKQ